MPVQIDQLEAFIAVVRRGGFTRAGQSLHLSQPAVSRRLEMLEQDLGQPLFDRTRGRAQLTEAGRAFLPHAEAVLAAIGDGREAVRSLAQPDRGTVTLAIVGTLAGTALTGRLERFRRAYPAVRLALRTALSREVSALVKRGEAALGVRYFAATDPDLVSVPLYRETLLTVSAPGHRLAAVRRPSARMLAGEPWVAFPARPGSTGESYALMLSERLGALGLGDAEILPIDSLTAQKRLVEAGFGLGLMPESAVEEELRLGTLRALPVGAMRLSVPVVLVYRRRAPSTGAARALMALLTETWRPARAGRRGAPPAPRPPAVRRPSAAGRRAESTARSARSDS